MSGPLRERLRSPRHRRTGLLSRADWTYLLGLVVPAMVLDLTLGWIRVSTQYNPPGLWGTLAQLQSDVLAHLGLLSAWAVLFVLLRSGWRRLALLVVLHASVMTYLVFAVAAHGYYRKTGSVLDAGTVLAASESPDLLTDLVASEATTAHTLTLVAVVGYGLLGPVVLTRLWRGCWLPGVTARPAALGSAVAGPARRRRVALLAGTLSLVLVAGSAATTFTGGGAFSRNRAMDVALELASAALEPQTAAANHATLPQARLAPSARAEKRNVVMIFMESVRAEATSVYNPDRSTTPFLAALSRKSLVADNAYAVLPHTSKSITAAHCGVEPALDTEAIESDPGTVPAICLPGLLRQEGYRTAFFQSAVGRFEDRPGLMGNLGFTEFHPVENFPTTGFERANYFGYEDDIMLEPAREWLTARQGQPFLLSMLTVTGHHDYRLPESFPQQRLSTEDEQLNSYLNWVRYQDRFVAKVFAMLEDLGLAEDTIVVVSGDHGEGFGEHGLRQHDTTIYNEGIKIPMMVYDPDRPARRVRTPVTNMTIPATVAELLGYRLTGGLSTAGSLLEPPTAPLRISCFAESRCLARIDGSTKYIHHFGNRSDEIFDLDADPEERTNLIRQHSGGELRALRTDLLDWRDELRSRYPARRPAR